jgi:hypothetical protein
MKNAQLLDLAVLGVDSIRDEIARAIHDQLASACSSPLSADLGLLAQEPDLVEDPRRDATVTAAAGFSSPM